MGLYLGQPSKSYSILPLPMSSSFTGSSSMDLYLHWPIIDMNFIKFFHFFFHECFIIMGFHCSLKALSTWTWLTKIVLLLSYFLGLVSQNTQWALEDLLIACLFFLSSSLPPFSFYSELLLALLSRPIGIGSCKRYMLGDFSIKAQNKPIIQSFNCKIFYDSATVRFYI